MGVCRCWALACSGDAGVTPTIGFEACLADHGREHSPSNAGFFIRRSRMKNLQENLRKLLAVSWHALRNLHETGNPLENLQQIHQTRRKPLRNLRKPVRSPCEILGIPWRNPQTLANLQEAVRKPFKKSSRFFGKHSEIFGKL